MSRYIKYQCPECGDLHDDIDEAEDCCPRDCPMQVFVCPECDSVNAIYEDAVGCCAAEEETMHMASPAELEAAGQMRLLP